MPITPEQVDLWRTAPSETQALEFKEAKHQYDTGKLLGYCVAIANERGGHLILGVRNSPPRDVVGTNAFQNPVKIAEHLFQSLGFRVDVDEVTHPMGRVLVFSIPSRPRGTVYHLEGKYLMRSGESLVPMSEDQLRTIFAEGKPDWLEEYSVVDVSMGDVVRLLNTQKFFELVQLPYPTDQYGVIDRLVNERLIDPELKENFPSGELAAFCWLRGSQTSRTWHTKLPELSCIPENQKWKRDWINL